MMVKWMISMFRVMKMQHADTCLAMQKILVRMGRFQIQSGRSAVFQGDSAAARPVTSSNDVAAEN